MAAADCADPTVRQQWVEALGALQCQILRLRVKCIDFANKIAREEDFDSDPGFLTGTSEWCGKTFSLDWKHF